MRLLQRVVTPGVLIALLACSTLSLRAADPPSQPERSSSITASPKDADAADERLRRGLELERQRNWTGAIEIYEEALHEWPSRSDVRHRLRLCESHYKLGRRYLDPSFKNVLLRLPADRALDLYDELLERIQNFYVEQVGFEPLLRKGLDNLEVALRDPTFLRTSAASTDAERIKSLREVYRSHRESIPIQSREEARAFVVWACNEGRAIAGLNAAPVVLEFAFGACDALDDYTTYLTPDKLDDLFGLIDGNFVGLGVELKHDPLGLRLVNVLRGGPAWEAGVRAGDKITQVNGQPLKGLSLDDSASRLQGPDGTAVDLVLQARDGGSRKYHLVRRAVEVQSVAQARIVDSRQGVAYIQLIGFQKTSTEELRRAITSLEKQGMRSLVLDLRGNPGGLLNIAVDIADAFLDSGVIVSTRGRASNQSVVYSAQPGAPWRMPLIVLVDHDSASASEILAGALKENRRATIMGERSYGKGSVQSIYPLRTAPAGLKLTTAKFYSPRNRPYSETGVEPDVAVSSRVAARVPADSDDIPSIELGDPAKDPVLVSAIQQAKRQLAGVRSN